MQILVETRFDTESCDTKIGYGGIIVIFTTNSVTEVRTGGSDEIGTLRLDNIEGATSIFDGELASEIVSISVGEVVDEGVEVENATNKMTDSDNVQVMPIGNDIIIELIPMDG